MTLNILFIGDAIGRPGRHAIRNILPELKKELNPDLIISNGENTAAGMGITVKVYNELIEAGIDIITQGNHIWHQKSLIETIDQCPYMVRPANFPPGVPGNDRLIYTTKKGIKVGVINLLGRVFMQALDDPFRVGEAIVNDLKKETPVIIIDIHAEATSEKAALGWFLDGRVSAVLGTHTHVQTADERILPKGTAFISDVGMVGVYNSIIGVEIAPILKRFVTQMPVSFEPAKDGQILFNAVALKIDPQTGKALEIKRVLKLVEGI